MQTPIDISNTDTIQSHALLYDIRTVTAPTPSPSPSATPGPSPSPTPSPTPSYSDCYDISVSNIPVMPVSNGNQIRFFIMESSASISRNMRTVTVIIPQETDGGSKFVVDGVSNQTVDGIIIPLVKDGGK